MLPQFFFTRKAPFIWGNKLTLANFFLHNRWLWWLRHLEGLCFSDIPNRVGGTKTDVQLSLQFATEYFTLFHIITSSIFSQISKLNFDYCWCIDMYYYFIFLIKMSLPISGIVGCYLKFFFLNHQLLGGGEETIKKNVT